MDKIRENHANGLLDFSQIKDRNDELAKKLNDLTLKETKATNDLVYAESKNEDLKDEIKGWIQSCLYQSQPCPKSNKIAIENYVKEIEDWKKSFTNQVELRDNDIFDLHKAKKKLCGNLDAIFEALGIPEELRIEMNDYDLINEEAVKKIEELKAELEKHQDPTENEKRLLKQAHDGFMGEIKELKEEIFTKDAESGLLSKTKKVDVLQKQLMDYYGCLDSDELTGLGYEEGRPLDHKDYVSYLKKKLMRYTAEDEEGYVDKIAENNHWVRKLFLSSAISSNTISHLKEEGLLLNNDGGYCIRLDSKGNRLD